MKRFGSLCLFTATALMMTACGGGDHQDLRQWMQTASKDLKGNIPALPQLKPFPIVSYDGGGLTDPFRPSKIQPDRSLGGGGKVPDFDRPKEPLEAFPLESLRLVGIMTPLKGNNKTPYALIRSTDGLAYVMVGSHLGQDFGVVTAITAEQVKIKETIKDPTGQTANWVDREVSLHLEGAKK